LRWRGTSDSRVREEVGITVSASTSMVMPSGFRGFGESVRMRVPVTKVRVRVCPQVWGFGGRKCAGPVKAAGVGGWLVAIGLPCGCPRAVIKMRRVAAPARPQWGADDVSGNGIVRRVPGHRVRPCRTRAHPTGQVGRQKARGEYLGGPLSDVRRQPRADCDARGGNAVGTIPAALWCQAGSGGGPRAPAQNLPQSVRISGPSSDTIIWVEEIKLARQGITDAQADCWSGSKDA